MKTDKMKTDKTKQTVFPLTDARLAIDIAAIRDQLTKLCADLRYDSRDKPQAVLKSLDDVQRVLGDALGIVLTVKP